MTGIKKAAPDQESGSLNTQENDNTKAIKLDSKTRSILLRALPETAKQARRLVGVLAFNPDSPTNRLNRGSGVNLSSYNRIWCMSS